MFVLPLNDNKKNIWDKCDFYLTRIKIKLIKKFGVLIFQ